MDEILIELRDAGFPIALLVGSRVTCKPAPTNTDQDVLVLLQPGSVDTFSDWAYRKGFNLDGSEVEDYFEIAPSDTFQSYSNGTINYIVTQDPIFYGKFKLATAVAKQLNLLQKTDRITLFQAILYGNYPVESPAVDPIES